LQSQPQSSFTLVFGNKSRASIIFFDELEAIKNKYIQRFNFINILSRERTDASLNYGRIDEEKLTSLQHILNYRNFSDIYICGPEKMIFTAKDFFEKKGIEKTRIHFELFTVPGQPTTGTKQKEVVKQKDTGPKSKVTIKLDGRSFDFDLGYKSESVLEAALQQGADLPFACKGGVCSTCRARLISGQVEMDVNYALEPEEVAAGFILTCQSHPRTEKIVVDFDVK